MNKALGIFKGGLVSKLIRVLTSVKFIVSVGVIVLLGTAIAWCYYNSTNKDRIFWGMIDQNLKTSAYTRHVYQKSGAQSVDQIFQTATTPYNRVYSETTFNQTGVDSAQALTKNIGVPTQDFVQYTSIVTAQKGTDGKTLDFSKILGVWGATDVNRDDNGQPITDGQIYGQAVLGFVPIGNLPYSQRQQIVSTMKKNQIYEYAITNTQRNWLGRPTYTIQVTVNLGPYIAVLKTFSDYTGLNNLANEDPERYAGRKVSFNVSVDGWTHLPVSSSQAAGSRTETINGHNLRKPLPKAPKETMPVDQLQSILQSIQ